MSSSQNSLSSSSSTERNKELSSDKNGYNSDDGNKSRKQQHVIAVSSAADEPPPLTRISDDDYDEEEDDKKVLIRCSQSVPTVANIPVPPPLEMNPTIINNQHSKKVAHFSKSVPTKDQCPPLTEIIPTVDQGPFSRSSRPRRRVWFAWTNNDNNNCNDKRTGEDDKSNQDANIVNKQDPTGKIRSEKNTFAREEPPPLTPQQTSLYRYKNLDGFSRPVACEKKGFSDSVLTLPNLLEFIKNQENDKAYETEQAGNYDDDDDDNVREITRSTPKTNLKSTVDDGEWEKTIDENNNNDIFWPSASRDKLRKHVSYLFQSDRSEIERLTKLMPRGREYVMFNVFTDFGRLFFRKRRKHVAFPSEFLLKYQEQGDVAGKDRFVPATSQPLKQTVSKKRKLSAVYSTWSVKSTDFQPRVDRVDDVNKCDIFCERCCISSDCCRISSSKSDFSSVMEGYWNDLNLASAFLHGHASRTFESALSNLEFIKFHNCPTNVIAQTPWSKSYNKQNLGILSGSIWIFTYCIRTIITQTREKDAGKNTVPIPTESSFRKMIEQFAAMCVSVAENVKIILQYSHNFYNFCKECRRIIRVILVILGTKHEIKLKAPLKRGDGLHLDRSLKQKDIMCRKGVLVKVAKNKPPSEGEADEALEWKNFAELSGNDKATSLRSLLSVTNAEIGTVQTQMRFLMDDIVDSVKDLGEADLLYLLADMYDRIKVLQSYGLKRCNAEIEQITKAMNEFCKDFQSFVDYGQHIMKRYVEFRDMVHLSYQFMLKGLKVETLSEMVPLSTFKKRKRKIGCCGGGERERRQSRVVMKRKVVQTYHPKYAVLDFFRVYYEDAVKAKGEIYANKFSFHIDVGLQPINAIIPVGSENIWGEMESPRNSLDEYAENEEEDLDDEIALGGAGDKDVQIKPILVTSSDITTKMGGSKPGSPGPGSPGSVSPRGSGGDEHAAAIVAAAVNDKNAANIMADAIANAAASGTTSTPKGAKRGSNDSEGSDKGQNKKK